MRCRVGWGGYGGAKRCRVVDAHGSWWWIRQHQQQQPTANLDWMDKDACPGAAHMRIHACQVAAVDRRRKEQKEPKSPATHGRTHGWRVSERVTGRERMDARGSGLPAPVRAWGGGLGYPLCLRAIRRGVRVGWCGAPSVSHRSPPRCGLIATPATRPTRAAGGPQVRCGSFASGRWMGFRQFPCCRVV